MKSNIYTEILHIVAVHGPYTCKRFEILQIIRNTITNRRLASQLDSMSCFLFTYWFNNVKKILYTYFITMITQMSIDRLFLFTRHIFIDNLFEGLHAGIHWRLRVKWHLVLSKIRAHNYKFSGSFMHQYNIVFFIKMMI